MNISPETAAKSAVRVGWGVTALALVTPALIGATGFVSAVRVGELTVEVGFAWVVMTVVIDLVLRKRPPLTKANGRIATAALTFVLALTGSLMIYLDSRKVDDAKKQLIGEFMASTVEAKKAAANPVDATANPAPPQAAAQTGPQITAAKTTLIPPSGSEAERIAAFLVLMKAPANKFAADTAALEKKFNDLGTVLTTDTVSSRELMKESRKKIETAMALISQRDALVTQYFAAIEDLIRDAGLSEGEVRDFMLGFNPKKSAAVQAYADLTAVQLASLKVTGEVISFVDRNFGRYSLKNGEIEFQMQSQADEYLRLSQALEKAAEREEVVTQRVASLSNRAKQNLANQYTK